MLVTITYDKIEYRAVKTGKCGCGKMRRRQKTFWQTQNAFNKDAQGNIKILKEIYAELHKEAEDWKKEPITCDNCS